MVCPRTREEGITILPSKLSINSMQCLFQPVILLITWCLTGHMVRAVDLFAVQPRPDVVFSCSGPISNLAVFGVTNCIHWSSVNSSGTVTSKM